MNARQEIKITGSRHEETGWKRYIFFEYEGNEYELTLFWDEFNGYEIYWGMPEKAPEWAVNWDKDMSEGQSLEHWLDELTFERDK
jgi:hypothetical protein